MKKIYMLLFLLIILLGTSCHNDNPVGPGDLNGKIIFSMTTGATPYNSGQTHIYVINADGSGFKQLTFGSYEDMPRWSPDGSQIVFISDSLSTSLGSSMWIMNADGSNWRPVKSFNESPHAMPGYNPNWSPDGKMITFDWSKHAESGIMIWDIYTVDLNTTKLKQITFGDPIRDTIINYPIGNNTQPVYSPDGNKIYFSSSRTDSLNSIISGIFSMNSDGSNVQKIITTSNNLEFYARPAVSPDGKKIIFIHSGTQSNALYISNIDGLNSVKLSDPPNGAIYSPRWLPDGEKIMFTSGNIIFIININGTNLTRLPLDNIKTMYFDWTGR